MKSSSYIILNAQLQTLSSDHALHLRSFLPSEMQQELNKHPSDVSGISTDAFSDNFIINYVHYSWFLPTLKMYEPNEIALFLAVLPSQTREHLSNHLKSKEVADLKTPAKSFLELILQVSLIGEEVTILPPKYLPSSPLNILADLEKNDLIRLISHLALYDLAKEIKQIVDPELLKQIDQALQTSEKKYLKKILKREENIPYQKMNLKGLSQESFRNQLHKRGLARLAAALTGQHDDLIWYVTHRLDIGRGNALMKAIDKKNPAHVVKVMVDSVMEALK